MQLNLEALASLQGCRVCGQGRYAVTLTNLCWDCYMTTPEWAARRVLIYARNEERKRQKKSARWRAGRKEEENE